MIQEVVIQMSKIKVLIYINNNGMKKKYSILIIGISIILLMIAGHWTYCQYREYCLNKESEEQTKEYLAKEFDKEIPKAYPFLLRCQAELTIYASMIEHSAIAAYDLSKKNSKQDKYKELYSYLLHVFSESPSGKSAQKFIYDMETFSRSYCFKILMYGGAYRQDEVNKLLEFVQARNYFLHIENKNYEEVIKNMKKVQEACFGCVDVLRKYHSNETDLKAWAYHEKLFDEMMQQK